MALRVCARLDYNLSFLAPHHLYKRLMGSGRRLAQ
jgi:hypothetical protein